MREPGSTEVAVVGAAGFVGRQLLRSFGDAGIRASVVCRSAPELSLDGTFHVPIPIENLNAANPFEVVVNLAYPVEGSPVSYPTQNQQIFSIVQRLLKQGGHLIHVSTQAVFGLALDRPIVVGPVAKHRDEPYVEAKIEAEKYFEQLDHLSRATLDIVRLGNVWGAASPTWTVPLIQRLLTGRPVGVRGVAGFSNTTDVANAASYLTHLLQSERPAGVHYHHLAEFSTIPWVHWIDALAGELGVEPVCVEPEHQPADHSAREELAVTFAPVAPRNLYRTLARKRSMGSWARSALRLLPEPLFSRLKGPDLVFAAPPDLAREECILLAVMTAKQEFKTRALPSWNPPVGKDESLDRVLNWLRAG